MANTTNLHLPLIDSNMTADVPRDMNALAHAVDGSVDTAAISNKVIKRDSAGRAKVAAPAAADDVDTKGARDTAISTAVNGLINAAPGALDTLKELADAMGDDPNFATTVTNALATKATQADVTSHLADYIRHPAFAATTGTSTAYTVTLSPVLPAYIDGVGITIVPHVDCGASPTLNISALGAGGLKKQDGSAYSAGELKANTPYSFRSVGTDFLADSSGGLDSFFGDGSDGAFNPPELAAITTAPNGGTIANLWDGTPGTTFTTNSLASGTEQTILTIDFGTDYSIYGYVQRFDFFQASISTGAARNLNLYWSNDGSNWAQQGSGISTTTTLATKLFNNINAARRYWQLRLASGGSACAFNCTGVSINGVSTTPIWQITFPVTAHSGAAIKQYSSFNLPTGITLTTENPCRGLMIYCQGNVDVSGSIDMSKKGSIGYGGQLPLTVIFKKKTSGTINLDKFNRLISDLEVFRGGTGGNGGNGGVGANLGSPTTAASGGTGGAGRICIGGIGGGGAGGTATGVLGGVGGNVLDLDIAGINPGYGAPVGNSSGGNTGRAGIQGSGGTGGAHNNNSTAAGLLIYGGLAGMARGGGGGGSGGAMETQSNSVNDTSGSASASEYAGGFICILAAGNITINAGGTIKADGGKGGNGASGATSRAGSFESGGGGGGGGSGGGVVALFRKGAHTNSGSITVAGGVAGSGGSPTGGLATSGSAGSSGSVGSIHTLQIT